MGALPPVLVELRANASEFMAALGAAQAQMTKLGTEGASSAAKFGAASKVALLGLGAAATVAAVESLKLASSFQSSMEQIHTQAGASQAEVNKMSRAVLGLAGATATAPEELAKGLFHLESAGLHGARALAALRAAAEGAKIGHADLESVTNALNAAIVSGIPGVQNMSQAMGALNGIVGSGDMRMQDLADALGTGVLAGVKQFGLSLNDVGAALATFGDNNIRGADAATQLRMAVLFMAKPAATAKDALDKIGMSTTQLAKDMQSGGLIKAVGDLHDHLAAAGDTGAKAGQVILDAFGHKAGTGISILVDQYSRLTQKSAEVAAASKNFASDWDATTKTFQFRMEQVQAAAEAVGIVVGTFLMKAIDDAIVAFQDIAHAVEATVGWFERHKEVTGALAGVLAVALVPALITAASAAAALASEAVIAGLWKMANGASALVLALIEAGPEMLVVVAAAAALGAASIGMWQQTANAIKAGKQAADDFTKSLGMSHDSLASLAGSLPTLQGKMQDLAKAATSGDLLSSGATKTRAELAQLIQTYQQTAAAASAMSANETTLAGVFGMTTDQVEALAKANNIDLTGSAKQVAGAFEKVVTAATQTHNPMAQAHADIQTMQSVATTAAEAVKALKDAFDELAGKALSADEAAITFRNNLAQLKAALDKSHGSLSLNSQASRDARQAFDTAAQSSLDLAASLKDSGRSNDAVRASLKQSIAQLQATAGNTDAAKAAIARLKTALDQIPGSASKAATGLKKGAADAKQSGIDFSQGFANGITAGEAAAMRAAYNLGKMTAIQLKNAIRSGSPSKVTMAEGDNFVAGFVNRIKAGTAAAAAAAATLGKAAADALAGVTSAVDPRTGSLPDLIGGYASSRAGAVSAAGSANIAVAHYSEIAEHAAALTARYDDLRAADAAAEAAARKHATALSNVAHEALRAAEAMSGHTKAQQAAKKAALEHARALEDEARVASQAASALVHADMAREASSKAAANAARAAADKAKQSYQDIAQAAKDAATAAQQAARDLIASVQSEADQLTQAINGFVSSASQQITGQVDFSALWGGADGTTKSADEFQAGLDAILARAQKFSTDLQTLTAAGASQDLINGLLGMGPQAGDDAAASLISTGQDAITKANQTLAAIANVGGAGAQDLAKAFYGQGVSAFDQFVAGLKAKFPELDVALSAIAAQVNATLGTTFGTAVGVAPSGALGAANLPGMTSPGLSPPNIGGGGTTIVVNVSGSVLTPIDLGDAVHTALLQKQRRTGSLGLT